MEILKVLMSFIMFFSMCFLMLKVIPKKEKRKAIQEIEKNNPEYYLDKDLKIHKIWAVGE